MFTGIIKEKGLVVDIEKIPWVGLIVAISWSVYNLIRKKINVDTDIGLFIESLYILPFALIIWYLIYKSGFNNFTTAQPVNIVFLFLGGVMTVIPLFLFIKGLEKTTMATSGLIFFFNPNKPIFVGFFLL